MRCLLFLLLFLPLPVSAQIILNEIAWMGSSVPGVDEGQAWRYEWAELYNSGDQETSLEGWTFSLEQGSTEVSIPLAGTIASKSYVVVGASSLIPEVTISYQSLRGFFENAGQLVSLRDGKKGVVDMVDARSGWPAGSNEEKLTMERVGESWQTSLAPGGTPGKQNSSAEQLLFPHTNRAYLSPVRLTDPRVVTATLLGLASALVVMLLGRARA